MTTNADRIHDITADDTLVALADGRVRPQTAASILRDYIDQLRRSAVPTWECQQGADYCVVPSCAVEGRSVQQGEELLPCPFCGGEVTEGHSFRDGRIYWYIVCVTGTCYVGGQHPDYAELAAWWNRRSAPAPSDVRELADALHDLEGQLPCSDETCGCAAIWPRVKRVLELAHARRNQQTDEETAAEIAAAVLGWMDGDYGKRSLTKVIADVLRGEG
jgi:hypothetical protein